MNQAVSGPSIKWSVINSGQIQVNRNSLEFRESFIQTGGSTDVGALLIVMGLALAIACFTLAVIPARSVPWRPGAIFVSERQADLTIVGLALLMAAAFTVFWTKGP